MPIRNTLYFCLILIFEYGNPDHRVMAPYRYNRNTHALEATFNQKTTYGLLMATLTLSGNQLIMKGNINQEPIDT